MDAYREWTDQEANVRVLHSALGDEEVTGSALQKGVPLLEEVWTQGSRTRPLPVCTHLRLREQEGAWKSGEMTRLTQLVERPDGGEP